jgi:hypothetical protein
MSYRHYWYINTETPEKIYNESFKVVKSFVLQEKITIEINTKDLNIDFHDDIDSFRLPFKIEDHPVKIFTKESDSYYFSFANTDLMPHDMNLVAILTILKVKLGNYITIRSDGNPTSLGQGIVLGLNFLNFNSISFDFDVNNDRPRMETIYECIFQSGPF